MRNRDYIENVSKFSRLTGEIIEQFVDFDVSRALEIQQQLKAQGIEKLLGQIAVEYKMIDQDTLNIIMTAQAASRIYLAAHYTNTEEIKATLTSDQYIENNVQGRSGRPWIGSNRDPESLVSAQALNHLGDLICNAAKVRPGILNETKFRQSLAALKSIAAGIFCEIYEQSRNRNDDLSRQLAQLSQQKPLYEFSKSRDLLFGYLTIIGDNPDIVQIENPDQNRHRDLFIDLLGKRIDQIQAPNLSLSANLSHTERLTSPPTTPTRSGHSSSPYR